MIRLPLKNEAAVRTTLPMSLRRSVIWTTVGSGIYLTCQYALLMALAKLGSPTLVGQFSLATAITAPVVIFSQMQLRQLQVTDAKGEYLFADYFSSRVLFSVVALVIIGVVILVSGYSAEMNVIIGLIGVAKVFESLSDIAHGKLQRHERMDYVAVSLAIKGIASLLLFSGVLWWTQSLLWAVAGLAAVWAIILLAYDLPMLSRVWECGEKVLAWRYTALRRLALLALPLALTSGLTSLSGNIPRFFLDGLGGKEAVGFFSVASAPLAILTLLTGALSQATLARAANYFQAGNLHAFKRLAIRITLFQVLLGAGCTSFFALFGEKLLSVLFTPDYTVSAPVLTTMSAGMTIGGLAAFGSTVLAAGRMFRLQLANILIAVVAQVPICYYLIGSWGIFGAGWAEVVKYVLATVVLLFFGAWMLNNHFRPGYSVQGR